ETCVADYHRGAISLGLLGSAPTFIVGHLFTGRSPLSRPETLRRGDVPMTLALVRRATLFCALSILAPFVLAAQQATGTVSGRVTDASVGRGLPDVQVLITGTRIGAVTGPNGEFTMTGVPVGARSITVRRIGYEPVVQPVTVVPGSSTTADIALRVSAVNLSEVVVTGTGIATEKRKVGSNIATV